VDIEVLLGLGGGVGLGDALVAKGVDSKATAERALSQRGLALHQGLSRKPQCILTVPVGMPKQSSRKGDRPIEFLKFRVVMFSNFLWRMGLFTWC
jgi:hypothetical protein